MGNERYIVIESIGTPNEGKLDTRTWQNDWLNACKARKECQGWILDTETMTIYGYEDSKVRDTERDFKWYILSGFYDHGILAEEYNPNFKLKIGRK